MTRVYEFLIPGECPALKNDRNPVVGKGGKFLGTRPSSEVEKYIRNAKDKLRRLTPPGFEVIKSPTEVSYVFMIGVYSASYPQTLPKSDLDNAATTLQESLFTDVRRLVDKTLVGPVLEDDRQVADYAVKRLIIPDKDALYSRIWLWAITDWDQHEETQFEVLRKVNEIRRSHRR